MHRNLDAATAHVRHTIYRSAILPRLDYYSAVWDPHQECYKSELENVQRFAGSIITRQWKSTYPNILARLNWLPHHVHRKHKKLKVCYNIIINHSIIPPSVFVPHSHPSTHIHHSKPLFKPFVSTHAHRLSIVFLLGIHFQILSSPPHPQFFLNIDLKPTTHNLIFSVFFLPYSVICALYFMFCVFFKF